METIYFLLIISAVVIASILIVRNINAKSYLVGGKIDRVNVELDKVKKSLQLEPESQAELDYVEWFEARNRPTMAELAREEAEEREFVGVTMINDEFQPTSDSGRVEAVH